MSKKLILNVKKKKKILIALLNKKNKLIEYHKYYNLYKKKLSIGDIFLGKVISISKGLNSAFIDIGYKKYGFLHFNYLGLGNNVESIIFDKKNQKKNENEINKILKLGQTILVQIIKKPISNKGPKLTCKISLIGIYLILIPNLNKIFISKKIKNKKKKIYFKEKFKKIISKNGIIIRTLSKYKKFNFIKNEYFFLKKKWNLIKKKIIINYFKKEYKKIYSENNFIYCLLRDYFKKKFKYIICNNFNLYKKLIIYLYYFNRKKEKNIFYKKNKIFKKFNIQKQIKILFNKNVTLSDGSNLIIEHTEALHVIDINSNMKRIKENKNSALKINLLAIKEIVKQIILRNLGGIIIIDCIDMKKEKHKKKVFKYFKKKMKNDENKHEILPPSKFNIIQITRQRKNKRLEINNNEYNKKYIDSSFCLIKQIENFFNFYFFIKKKNETLYLHVHPFIANYLRYGFFSIRFKWFLKYKKWIFIISRFSYKYLYYKICNKKKKIFNFKY